MINFPSNPTSGDQYTFKNKVWQWNGTTWNIVNNLGNVSIDYNNLYNKPNTTSIIEGTNLYFTNARSYANVIQLGYETVSNVALKANITDLSNANVLTATKFATARNINSVAFDGSSDVSISSLVNGSDTLSLNGANKVDLPGGTAYIFAATNNITLAPDTSGSNYLEIINNVGATISTDRSFEIRTNSDGTNRVWSFTQGGSLFFPDSTYQTTAFNSNLLSVYATNTQLASYATISNVALKANIADLNTANVTEGTNQYFTNARTYANVIQIGYATNSNVALKANIVDLTTANVTEKTNLYFTNARATAAVISATLSNITVTGNVVAGNVRVDNGTVTANAATAFIAGTAAESGVALQMPREGAIRNMTNGQNTMYFDISNGGSAHGSFRFRSSSAFTELMDLSIDGPKSIAAFKGKSAFNAALDTVVTVDNLKFRISNQGGVFPQVASASGSAVDVCYSGIGYINGATNPATAHNSGFILQADGTWLSLFSTHGMDDRGDLIVFHIVDKGGAKIYRVTFMVTNNASNTTGYNIIVERII